MTSRQLYEGVLIELNKTNAPNILLEDFNYFANKAVNQYINKRYNIYDINQQTTDDLRVLKATTILPVSHVDSYSGLTLAGSGKNQATYEAILPSDYLHILNCICIYDVKKTYKCYNAGDTWRAPAKRLTADMYSQVIDNFWNKPTYKKPYYYIHNVNKQIELPTNPVEEDGSGTDYNVGSNANANGSSGSSPRRARENTPNILVRYYVITNVEGIVQDSGETDEDHVFIIKDPVESEIAWVNGVKIDYSHSSYPNIMYLYNNKSYILCKNGNNLEWQECWFTNTSPTNNYYSFNLSNSIVDGVSYTVYDNLGWSTNNNSHDASQSDIDKLGTGLRTRFYASIHPRFDGVYSGKNYYYIGYGTVSDDAEFASVHSNNFPNVFIRYNNRIYQPVLNDDTWSWSLISRTDYEIDDSDSDNKTITFGIGASGGGTSDGGSSDDSGSSSGGSSDSGGSSSFTDNTDAFGNEIADITSSLWTRTSQGYSNVQRSGGLRYGNASLVRLEIRYGSDNSLFQLKNIYIDYIKAPQNIRLTQEQIDWTEDRSQVLEFPDYVCQEIINELVLLILENISELRILTQPVVSQSIANPAQQLAQPQK